MATKEIVAAPLYNSPFVVEELGRRVVWIERSKGLWPTEHSIGIVYGINIVEPVHDCDAPQYAPFTRALLHAIEISCASEHAPVLAGYIGQIANSEDIRLHVSVFARDPNKVDSYCLPGGAACPQKFDGLIDPWIDRSLVASRVILGRIRPVRALHDVRITSVETVAEARQAIADRLLVKEDLYSLVHAVRAQLRFWAAQLRIVRQSCMIHPNLYYRLGTI